MVSYHYGSVMVKSSLASFWPTGSANSTGRIPLLYTLHLTLYTLLSYIAPVVCCIRTRTISAVKG